MISHCRSLYLCSRLSGNDVNIQAARQKVSVQSKIFANDSFDPVSGYGLPDLFRDSNAKARSRQVIVAGDNDKKVADMTLSTIRQRPVFYRFYYSIRLGEPESFQCTEPFSHGT
jgi:hypothetical protein